MRMEAVNGNGNSEDVFAAISEAMSTLREQPA